MIRPDLFWSVRSLKTERRFVCAELILVKAYFFDWDSTKAWPVRRQLAISQGSIASIQHDVVHRLHLFGWVSEQFAATNKQVSINRVAADVLHQASQGRITLKVK